MLFFYCSSLTKGSVLTSKFEYFKYISEKFDISIDFIFLEEKIFSSNYFVNFHQNVFYLYRAILKEFEKNNCNKIAVSGGPFSLILAALLASILKRKKMSVDYRDPWVFGGAHHYNRKPNFKSFFNKCYYGFFELIVLVFSNKVFTVSISIYQSIVYVFFKKKVELYSNGIYLRQWDQKLSNAVDNKKHNNRFLIIGNSILNETNSFVKISNFLNELCITEKGVNLVYVGPYEEKFLLLVNKYLGSEIQVHFLGHLSSSEYYYELVSSDAVFYMENSLTEYGTKIYDFLLLNILVLYDISENSNLFKKIEGKTNFLNINRISIQKYIEQRNNNSIYSNTIISNLINERHLQVKSLLEKFRD